jgi:hypothetical protein
MGPKLPNTFINQAPETIPNSPIIGGGYSMGPKLPSTFINRVPDRVEGLLKKSRVNVNVGTPDSQRGTQIYASDSGSHLVDYGFKIKNNSRKYGPNTGRIQALIGAVGSLSPEAKNAVRAASINWSPEWNSALDAANDSITISEKMRNAATDAVYAASVGGTDVGAFDAVNAELASHKLTAENYRILTNPLNVGLTYDRKIAELKEDPEKQAAFKRAIGGGGITTPEQVNQLGSQSRSTLDYFVGMPSNLTFDQKLKRAQGLSRADASRVRGTADRMENRAKAMGDKK